MPDIKVRSYTGDYIHYSGVERLWIESEDSTDESRELVPYTYGQKAEKQVDLDFSDGDMELSPETGELWDKVTIPVPEALTPENIAKDVTVAGITGTHEGGGGESLETEIIMGTISGSYANGAVTEVRPYLFSGCASLTDVSFPNCTSIGTYAFAGCTKLKEAAFPLCSYVGAYAFSGCMSISRVSLPRCKKLYSGAFSGPSSIAEMYLPECEEIWPYACIFVRSSAVIEAPKLKWVSRSAFTYYYWPSVSSIYYMGDVAISGAYRNYAALQESTRVIAERCFASSSYPTGASGPNVQYIGPEAYNNCSYLTRASFPECLAISTGAFQSCSRLGTISFPKCEIIGDSAFAAYGSASAAKFASADFPECTSIGDNAFQCCQYLDTISFPKCITIGSAAFSILSTQTALQEAVFPECTTIGSYAFYSNRVGRYDFPKVETIGSYALNLSSCFYLRLGSSKTISYSNIFSGSFSATTVTISGNAGWRGFSKMNFTSLRFMGVGTIYGSLFWSCTNLEQAVVENFGYWAGIFNYCWRMSRVRGLGAYIGTSAFCSCTSLAAVKCKYAPSYISNYAFYQCTKLSVLYIEKGFWKSYSSCSFGTTGVFTTVPTIYVPEDMVEAFQTAGGWSAYSSKITAVTDDIKAMFEVLL